MKAFVMKSAGWLFALLMVGVAPMEAQDAGDYLTITGVVKDKLNKKSLENVNVSVPGSNVGTVTNADGIFSLKIKTTDNAREVEVSHIGYHNSKLTLNKELQTGWTVWMTPYANLLNEVVVYANNPRIIVEEALKKIPVNYSAKNNLLTGFYRETVQKGRRYISISEAVIDIYKTDYRDRTVDRDKVQILKGRRLLSQKASDTLAVKVVGGPSLSIYLDIVKNGDALLSMETLNYYNFKMEEPVNIDNRMQYVVSLEPRVSLMYALFYGKLYIDHEKLSLTRAELNLDMKNKANAVQAILHKKPLGLRFKPQEVSFLVTYKDQNGKTYLNYIRNGIRFKCDWKRRLFSSGYAAFSEMVITDRKEDNLTTISSRNAFGANQVFYDKVNQYWNEDFWGAYNIIEPTETLEHAVDKLKKQSR